MNSKDEFPQTNDGPCLPDNSLKLIEVLAQCFGKALMEHTGADVATLCTTNPFDGTIVIAINTDLTLAQCGSAQCEGHFQAQNVIDAFQRDAHNMIDEVLNFVAAQNSKEQ